MTRRDDHCKLICVIDIGSNSIRTNVYIIDQGSYSLIYKDKFDCRFAKGLSKNNKFSTATIERALKYCKELATKLKGFSLYTIKAVATSAMRQAKNAAEFIEPAQEILKTRIEIISTQKEAKLAVRGTLMEIGNLSGLVLDLGGGSLEFAHVTSSRPQAIESLRLGHQVLADFASEGIDHLRSQIKDRLKKVKWLSKIDYQNIYMCGGQFRRLAKLHMKLTQGSIEEVYKYSLNRKEMRELIILKERNLKAKPESLTMYYSAVLLDELMDLIKTENFVFCGNSIREGILLDWL